MSYFGRCYPQKLLLKGFPLLVILFDTIQIDTKHWQTYIVVKAYDPKGWLQMLDKFLLLPDNQKSQALFGWNI